jgi:hypothetical protein
MADLKSFQVSDPVRADDINRLKQAIQQAFSDGDVPTSVSVTNLKTTPSVRSYTVKTSDEYLVIDASAGEFTVSLPTPKVKQVVSIVAGAATGTITIKRADAQKISGADKWQIIGFFLEVFGAGAARFVCDGTSWWRA